mgnify:CR=1 FL=1
MNIIEIINDLQLTVGDSRRMTCPVCYTKNTFTITNTMGKIVWNCYKASCTVSGATNVSMSVSDVRKALGYMTNELDPAPFVKPDYLVNDGPECWNFLKQYGLSSEDVIVLYDVKDHRIVFPVLDDRGCIVDGSGRSLGKRIPKWKRYGNSGLPYTFGCGKVAIVVEDCVSAAVVGYGSFVGVALLGTSLQESHKRYLAQFSTAVIALDPDALPKTLQMAKEVRGHVNDVRVLRLKDDLKYRNPTDMENLNGIITN